MGIGTFLNGLGYLLGKIPIQGRIERLKNERDSLIKERTEILRGKADEKKSGRVSVIDDRLLELNRLLSNSQNAN